MSVDSFVLEETLTREKVEQMGPRFAIQPVDDEDYRRIAEMKILAAEEDGSDIVAIELLGPTSLHILGNGGPVELRDAKHVALFNTLLGYVKFEETDVQLIDVVDDTPWGELLPPDEEIDVLCGELTILHESIGPHNIFQIDRARQALCLSSDVVVIDNRFLEKNEDTGKTQERTDSVEVDEAIDHEASDVALNGLARARKVFLKENIELVVADSTIRLNDDELAILEYLLTTSGEKVRRSDVWESGFWKVFDRSSTAQAAAFGSALNSLIAKLPDHVERGGIQGGAYLRLKSPLEMYEISRSATESEEVPERRNQRLGSHHHIQIDGVEHVLTSDELAVFTFIVTTSASEFRAADVRSSILWQNVGHHRTEMTDASTFSKAVKSLQDKLPHVFARQGNKGASSATIISRPEVVMSDELIEAFEIAKHEASFRDAFKQTNYRAPSAFEAAVYRQIITGRSQSVKSGQAVPVAQLIAATEAVLGLIEQAGVDGLPHQDDVWSRYRSFVEYVTEKKRQELLNETLRTVDDAMADGRTYNLRVNSAPIEKEDATWQDLANCLGVDPDLFFPERGASTREAKEVCRGCIVRQDCLEFALQNGEKFGIWGGMSERERRRIRRQRAQALRSVTA